MNFLLEDNWEDVPNHRQYDLSWKNANLNDKKVIYATIVGKQMWSIRMNDFPDEPLYTLIADGVEVIHFNNWPSDWIKPS